MAVLDVIELEMDALHPYLGDFEEIEAEAELAVGLDSSEPDLVEVFEALATGPTFLAPGQRTPCSEHGNPDLWFSGELSELREAAALCGGCSAITGCAAYARENRESGVWGGLIGGTTPVPEDVCSRGHADWGHHASGARFCRTCKADGQRARRARARGL